MTSTPFLYGLDKKIEAIYSYCKIFIAKDLNAIENLTKLSIYPTFLFDGYPGTGKSSVATIIHEKLKVDFNIDLKRLNIDELISSNFGESSKNLRDYFEQAKEEIKANKSYSFIIIDEIDSFTVSRHNHENESIKRILLTFNTIIDELIRTGEIFKFIIIGTTNLKESIDSSVLRRFYFKEDFNTKELNYNEFEKFTNELTDITTIKIDSYEEIYDIYKRKKFTLGEVKSIFSRKYIDNLAFNTNSSITPDDLKDKSTFYEILEKQIKGENFAK